MCMIQWDKVIPLESEELNVYRFRKGCQMYLYLNVQKNSSKLYNCNPCQKGSHGYQGVKKTLDGDVNLSLTTKKIYQTILNFINCIIQSYFFKLLILKTCLWPRLKSVNSTRLVILKMSIFCRARTCVHPECYNVRLMMDLVISQVKSCIYKLLTLTT